MFGLALAACAGTGGCGSSTGTLSGKVYHNGALVTAGKVTFFTADGKGHPTGIREDGSYLLEKLTPGAAKVCVDTSEYDPKRKKAYAYKPPPGKEVLGATPTDSGTYVKIPAKYADPAKTDLTCEITGGRQTHDIQLKGS